MKDFLEIFLHSANPLLLDYNEQCQIIDIHVSQDYSFVPKLYNERSVASFITFKYCEALVTSKSYNSVQCINEFAIQLDSPFTPEQFSDLKEELGLSHIKTPRRSLEYFYPDSYFHLSSISKSHDVFIEYKISSRFILAELSYDFIKYLIYSSKSSNNSTFIFAVLRRNGNDSLEFINDNHGKPLFYQISKDSVGEELAIQAERNSVFVYNKDSDIIITERSYLELDVLREIDVLLQSSKDSKISDDDVVKAGNFSTNPFVMHIDKFGENVITSVLIKKHYHEIVHARDLVIGASFSAIPLSKDCPLNMDIISGETVIDESIKKDFIEGLATYFNREIKYILKKIPQNKSVFNNSYRRSNWMLILISKFLELNHFYSEGSSLKLSELCENPEDESQINTILNQAYDNVQYRPNLNSIGLSLIYYITEVYPIIFNVSQESVTPKTEYRAYKKKKALINLIHDFNKIGVNKKRVRLPQWDTINLIDSINKIASSLIGKYL